MKPTARNIQIWDCGLGHNHTTEEIAYKCIKDKADRAERVKAKKHRYLSIVKSWTKTKNFTKTGKEFGVTGSSVRGIVETQGRRYATRVEKGIDHPVGWTDEMTEAVIKHRERMFQERSGRRRIREYQESIISM